MQSTASTNMHEVVAPSPNGTVFLVLTAYFTTRSPNPDFSILCISNMKSNQTTKHHLLLIFGHFLLILAAYQRLRHRT
jgi:hypothetical protein